MRCYKSQHHAPAGADGVPSKSSGMWDSVNKRRHAWQRMARLERDMVPDCGYSATLTSSSTLVRPHFRPGLPSSADGHHHELAGRQSAHGGRVDEDTGDAGERDWSQ